MNPAERPETVTSTIRERAKELRRPQTPAEERLWYALRAKRFADLKWRRQHPKGGFILDFYCAGRKLVVEVDGTTHAETAGYDVARTEWLEAAGLRVLRFSNVEVHGNLDGVLAAIAKVCGVA